MPSTGMALTYITVPKFGLEVVTGKALSFLLEFIAKTGENVFCSQIQIKLKSSFTLLS